MKMNKNQKLLLIVWLIVFCFSCFYVPTEFRVMDDPPTYKNNGYQVIFFISDFSRIIVIQLLVEWVFILVSYIGLNKLFDTTS